MNKQTLKIKELKEEIDWLEDDLDSLGERYDHLYDKAIEMNHSWSSFSRRTIDISLILNIIAFITGMVLGVSIIH